MQYSIVRPTKVPSDPQKISLAYSLASLSVKSFNYHYLLENKNFKLFFYLIGIA